MKVSFVFGSSPQTLNETPERSLLSHGLFSVLQMFRSQNRVHELNTGYNLNLLGATYYRLLLLSSCSIASSLLLSL